MNKQYIRRETLKLNNQATVLNVIIDVHKVIVSSKESIKIDI